MSPLNTFDPISVQFKYFKLVLRKFKEAKGIGPKFRALFYGPGYQEIKPQYRLGDPDGNDVFTCTRNKYSKIKIYQMWIQHILRLNLGRVLY